MVKKLPIIEIQGTEQEFVEIEMIIIMLGYDINDEFWNNNILSRTKDTATNLTCCKHGLINYFNTRYLNSNAVLFKASHINKIVDYVTNYKG